MRGGTKSAKGARTFSRTIFKRAKERIVIIIFSNSSWTTIMSTKPLKGILKRSKKVPITNETEVVPQSSQADEEVLEGKQPVSTGKEKKKRTRKVKEVGGLKEAEEVEEKEADEVKEGKPRNLVKEKAGKKKAAKKVALPQAQEESEVSDVEESGESPHAVEKDDNDSDYHLHGFSTDEDSSDEDLDIEDAGIDVGKLPTISKDDIVVKRKLDRAKRQQVCFTSVSSCRR
jgi:nucleolar protein 15